jgi:hypothetical protein
MVLFSRNLGAGAELSKDAIIQGTAVDADTEIRYKPRNCHTH